MRTLILLLLSLAYQIGYAQYDDSAVRDYWRTFDTESDSAIIYALEGMEGFVELLPHASSAEVVAEAYSALMKRAEHKPELWYCLRDNAEETFHGPNATYENYEIYIRLLDTFLASRHCTEGDKIRFDFQKENLNKNRIGTRAADLILHMDDDGKKRMLSDLCQGSDSVMLLFYDPLCDHCGLMIEELREDKELEEAHKLGKVKIIVVDIAPRRSWLQLLFGVKKKNPHSIPANWTRTEDRKGQVMDELVYHLPFVPQIYVLGKEMVVRKKGSPSPALP